MSDQVKNPADRFSHNEAHIATSTQTNSDGTPYVAPVNHNVVHDMTYLGYMDAINCPKADHFVLVIFNAHSYILRKHVGVFCKYATKGSDILCSNGADQLRSNCAADQRLCFRYIHLHVDSTLNPKGPRANFYSIYLDFERLFLVSYIK